MGLEGMLVMLEHGGRHARSSSTLKILLLNRSCAAGEQSSSDDNQYLVSRRRSPRTLFHIRAQCPGLCRTTGDMARSLRSKPEPGRRGHAGWHENKTNTVESRGLVAHWRSVALVRLGPAPSSPALWLYGHQ
jgi:hypothetical protein